MLGRYDIFTKAVLPWGKTSGSHTLNNNRVFVAQEELVWEIFETHFSSGGVELMWFFWASHIVSVGHLAAGHLSWHWSGASQHAKNWYPLENFLVGMVWGMCVCKRALLVLLIKGIHWDFSKLLIGPEISLKSGRNGTADAPWESQESCKLSLISSFLVYWSAHLTFHYRLNKEAIYCIG